MHLDKYIDSVKKAIKLSLKVKVWNIETPDKEPWILNPIAILNDVHDKIILLSYNSTLDKLSYSKLSGFKNLEITQIGFHEKYNIKEIVDLNIFFLVYPKDISDV